MRGFVLGGTRSGVGKTVATLAVCRALSDAGRTVQPAKAGPDYIDPSHHEQLVDRPSRTLDVWLEGVAGLRRNYHRGDGDVCVVEGVMGLYDGDASSTARVAEALDLPVVLVVDAEAGMESVAATALGFEAYADSANRDVDVAGVLLQRAHGGRHEEGIRQALPDGLRYFGRIPPSSALSVPDRHLGLYMGDEAPIDPEALGEASAFVDAAGLYEVAREATRPEGPTEQPPSTGPRPRIAVAQDDAFRFVYPHTRERLASGSDLVTFAPTAGDPLPACDAVYLPGGYPERHAETLASAPALEAVATRGAEGLPVYGECGGLMVLAESLRTTDGSDHRMAGLLPAAVEMCDRYQALDHVELAATETTTTARAGDRLRGHEFHYSTASVAGDASFAFEVVRGDGIDGDRDGLTEYDVLGTYAHCHAESGAFDRLLEVAGT